MDTITRTDVVKWLRARPDVDVMGLANEAKAQWGCSVDSTRIITAAANSDGDIRIPLARGGHLLAHIFLKPGDAAAFARHILELVKS